MKRTLTVWMMLIITALVLAVCAPVESLRADSAQWQTEEALYQYKNVKTGSVKVGGVDVPIYGNRWRVVDTAILTGTDVAPVYPQVFDCPKVQPSEPELGDQYCGLSVRYFLWFGDESVEVSQEVWSSHTPESIYQVQRTLFGLVLAPEK